MHSQDECANGQMNLAKGLLNSSQGHNHVLPLQRDITGTQLSDMGINPSLIFCHLQ